MSLKPQDNQLIFPFTSILIVYQLLEQWHAQTQDNLHENTVSRNFSFICLIQQGWKQGKFYNSRKLQYGTSRAKFSPPRSRMILQPGPNYSL